MEFKPGAEFDEMVAEKIMGFQRAPSAFRVYWKYRNSKMPFTFNPSTNQIDAMTMLREMQGEDWELQVRLDVSRGSPEGLGLWNVDVDSNSRAGKGGSLEYEFAWALSKALAEFFFWKEE